MIMVYIEITNSVIDKGFEILFSYYKTGISHIFERYLCVHDYRCVPYSMTSQTVK